MVRRGWTESPEPTIVALPEPLRLNTIWKLTVVEFIDLQVAKKAGWDGEKNLGINQRMWTEPWFSCIPTYVTDCYKVENLCVKTHCKLAKAMSGWGTINSFLIPRAPLSSSYPPSDLTTLSVFTLLKHICFHTLDSEMSDNLQWLTHWRTSIPA